MDKFLDTARKLTKGSEQYGFGGDYSGGKPWMDGASYFGTGPVDLANRKITINTSTYRQGLQFWVDVANAQHVKPSSQEAAQLRSTPNEPLFLTGKFGMNGIFNLAQRPSFRWAVATLPYTPSAQQPRNVSGRIGVHSLHLDSESKQKDLAWEVFKYWAKAENDARYVLSDGHVVSPLRQGGSDIALQDYKNRMGADPKAFLLQAQHSKLVGWGYFLLKDWKKANSQIEPMWSQVAMGQLAVGDFALQAQNLTSQLTSF